MIRPQRHIASVLLLAVALSSPMFACVSGGQQLDEIVDEAQSDVAASAFVLDRLHSGDVTTQFASASLREYATSLEQRAKALEDLKAKPAEQERQRTAEMVLADARDALQDARANVSRERAGPIAQRLHDDEQKLKSS